MALQMSLNVEEHMDWKGQKANPRKHGGAKAASITCVVEVLENLVFLSNATNFVAYFIKSMHYPTAEAANMVTNFLGTSFLLTIFGGFICDSFFTRFKTFIIFCAIELLGLILLTFQALYHPLQPEINRRPSLYQAAILYTGLYAIAIGVGGVKASLPAHGADQLDRGNQRSLSAFFNWFFFSLCTGGLIASTVMIWIEENRGWNWSFLISIVALSIALCIFAIGFPIYRYKHPKGSAITRIFKVRVQLLHDCRFLDKALLDDTISAADVEETKTFLGLLPIFASTIMMNCCLAQLHTFSVQQGSIMNRKLKDFQIPTQSMTVFPLIIMLASITLYEHYLNTLKKKVSTAYYIFHPLKRIGLGLALASGAMVVAAMVEAKRQKAAERNEATISVFWLGWQYLLLGVSDMLTLGGMLEFFYSQAPDNMRSICTALSWCSTSMGYFLSSVLVSVTNFITGKFGHQWLGGHDLNHTHLDFFYTILSVLNFLNFLNFIYWARRY
ncbi:protein NRT1/ PTR FAMILY 4.2-like [Ricinus communis]|uniref:protein NRT1/ PTR FAMILY 4.2-like n=1 Tax=Ricinus communis TaxID=3988 RepID=UPI00201A8E60|nr:protein NRT1/ PTR FAMILY 4.2-like [Ricinus communis]